HKSMNISKIKKQYDKLTVEERVSAMIAAWGRDDMEEYKTLGRTAPFGKSFTVRNHHGLLSGWEFLAMWHVMNQLGHIATLFFFLFYGEGKFHVKGIDFGLAMTLINKRIVEASTGLHEICKEHNLDPNDALNRLPFLELVSFGEIMANAISIEWDIQ